MASIRYQCIVRTVTRDTFLLSNKALLGARLAQYIKNQLCAGPDLYEAVRSGFFLFVQLTLQMIQSLVNTLT